MKYQTRAGDEIDLVYTLDSERERNQDHPWVVHKITALIGGTEAGYIKISYIPAENLPVLFPGLLNWITKQTGRGILPWDKWQTPASELSVEEKRRAVMNMCNYRMGIDRKVWPYGWGSEAEIAALAEAELDHYLAIANNPKHNKDAAADYKKFVDFHASRPLVDYIRVHNDWQRQGVGLSLYHAAAAWMHRDFGLRLHASGLQQPEAKAAWEKMTRLGWVVADGDRRVIDPTAIPG